MLLFAVGFTVSSHGLWLLFIMLAFNLFFSPMIPLTDALAATWQKQLTVAEVIVFTFSHVLFRHWQVSGLLLLSASCAVVRWGLMAYFTTLPILITP
ncbi:hypothetical protein [Candidatus Arsenophonus triatominarum]|uniref:hypothetical protein n=1 Tax=Candidatus Arsenophonus triatominarum TaxID=57911 RepID=UPI001396C364|nr:hypothetical protein [Candidatus Arsenophonus triatominarum]